MAKHVNTVATNDKNEKISLIGHYDSYNQVWDFWQVLIQNVITLKKESFWFAGSEFRAASQLFDEVI